MANSSKGAGNFLGPLFIVAVLVVGGLVLTFALSGEEAPDEPTIIADDQVESRPAGAGTVPEGNADPEMQGITDEIDEVDPAAPDEETVPPAEEGAGDSSSEASSESSGSGEDAAGGDSESSSAASQDTAVPVGTSDPAATGEDGATGDAARLVPAEEGSDDTQSPGEDSFLIEEGSGDGEAGDEASSEGASLPEGRDARTDLEAENGEEIVEDTDSGGTAFVPTPSGPEGRDDSALTQE